MRDYTSKVELTDLLSQATQPDFGICESLSFRPNVNNLQYK